MGIDLKYIFQRLILKFVVLFLVLLCTPYFIVFGILTHCNISHICFFSSILIFSLFFFFFLVIHSHLTLSYVYRFSFPVFALLLAFYGLLQKLKRWFPQLKQSIIDERYLIGKRLLNYVSGRSESNPEQRT